MSVLSDTARQGDGRGLLIVDRYDSVALERIVSGRDGGAWDVLMLELSDGWWRWRSPAAGARAPQVRIIDPVPLAAEAHRLVRQFVLESVAALPWTDLGGETLWNAARTEDDHLWWFLEMSERSAFRGELIPRLYQLARIRLALGAKDYARVSIDIADGVLRGVVCNAAEALPPLTDAAVGSRPAACGSSRLLWRAALRFPQAAARIIGWKAILSWHRWRLPDGAGDGVVSFTFFPQWWTAPFSGKPRDRFLPLALEGGVQGYLAWLDTPIRLWKARRQTGKAIAERALWPLQAALQLSDIGRLCRPNRLRAFARTWKLAPRARLTFAGFQIGPLIAVELRRCLASGELLQDLLLATAVSRAATRLGVRAVVFRSEFQPTEHAIVLGLRGRARAVGFLHHPFWENYLAMRFTPAEAKTWQRGSRPDDRPLPDAFICNGSSLADHLRQEGVPADRVALCGPQRLAGLMAFRERGRSRSELRASLGFPVHSRIVFVALAIRERDTEALFAALVEASSALGDARLVVRTHPNRPAGDPALQAVLQAFGPERIQLMPASGNLYDWIAAADVMVGIGSTIAFEAMALGVMPIVFQNPATFDVTALTEYGDALFVVRDGRELTEAVIAALAGAPNATARQRRWPAVLDSVLGDLNRPLGEQLAGALRTVGIEPAPLALAANG